MRPIILGPRKPESKGQVERTIGYVERSFLPLRSFSGIADLQARHDNWASSIALCRHHRRVGARVTDASTVERGFLCPLPDPLPDVDHRFEVRITKDGFCRAGDYSVAPGLSGPGLQGRVSPSEVVIGIDPHKSSNTAVASLGIDSSLAGYRVLLKWGRQFSERWWAIENAKGLGSAFHQGRNR